MKRRYTVRHVRRIIQKRTEADLENTGISAQVVERPLEDSPVTSNIENELDSTSCSEDEQRYIVDNVDDSTDILSNSDRQTSSDSNASFHEIGHSASEIDLFDNSDSDNDLCKEFKKDVASWAIEQNVPQNTCNSMLSLLRKYTDYSFPKDIRTLLRTPRTSNVKPLGNGSYCHFGLCNIIQQMVLDSKEEVQNINLLLNMDGLPLFKSSKAELWPILCSNDISKKVYIVGAYYGFNKPNDCNQYLRPFVNELVSMINNGFRVNEKRLEIRLYALICDTPAKSFVLNVKPHTGYYSCTTCTIEGSWKKNRMCFTNPTANTRLRTDEDFALNRYEDYQTGYTILNTVPHFGPVSGVPRDYLHLVCYGATKKIVLLISESGPLSVRIPVKSIDTISDLLWSLRDTTPNDFARRPRALRDVRRWKATEFRSFLLYKGPIVLKDIVEDDVYKHFITLHVAITILINPIFCKVSEHLDYAEALLKHFVASFATLYGEEYVSHNIHNLLHLTSDVRKYGPLDAFSAFRFESFLSSIEKLVRKSEKPLEQLARRYHEIQVSRPAGYLTRDHLTTSKQCFTKLHSDGPLAGCHNVKPQYKVISNHLFSINCDSHRNNCCMLKNGECIIAENIIERSDNEMYIVGKKLTFVDNLYTVPCESKTFYIKIVSASNSALHFWPVSQLECKLWKMPYKRNYVVVPVIHTM